MHPLDVNIRRTVRRGAADEATRFDRRGSSGATVEITPRRSGESESDLALEDPIPVEGVPGVGLAGKIATDHLVREFEMEPCADVVGESLPPVAVFEDDDPDPSGAPP